MKFRPILALDLLDGVVVHAKRGEREKYRPIHLSSSIVSSSEPIHVLEEIKPKETYIADLNKLMGTGNNKERIKGIRNLRKTRIMLDYGVREMGDLKEASEIADCIVLGTETASLDLIEKATKDGEILNEIALSIDLYNKKVLSQDRGMKINPLSMIKKLNEYSMIRDVIVLELDKVGTKSGIDFDFLSHAVEVSNHNILCGGGVRNCEDVYELEKAGVKGALVATAVHDGSIPKNFL